MFKTLTAVTQGVIKKIGLVNGTSVQTYTEPQIKVAIQDAFLMVFRKRYWEHMSDWYTATLDGATGVVTSDLSAVVKSIEDIKLFYVGSSTRQRITKPENIEGEYVTGGTPLFYKPLTWKDPNFTTKVFKVLPITATGTIRFYARTCPDEFNDTDIVPMHSDMMEWAGAWMTLETDGLNPGNANKANSLFQVAYNDIVSNLNDDAIGIGTRRNVNTIW